MALLDFSVLLCAFVYLTICAASPYYIYVDSSRLMKRSPAGAGVGWKIPFGRPSFLSAKTQREQSRLSDSDLLPDYLMHQEFLKPQLQAAGYSGGKIIAGPFRVPLAALPKPQRPNSGNGGPPPIPIPVLPQVPAIQQQQQQQPQPAPNPKPATYNRPPAYSNSLLSVPPPPATPTTKPPPPTPAPPQQPAAYKPPPISPNLIYNPPPVSPNLIYNAPTPAPVATLVYNPPPLVSSKSIGQHFYKVDESQPPSSANGLIAYKTGASTDQNNNYATRPAASSHALKSASNNVPIVLAYSGSDGAYQGAAERFYSAPNTYSVAGQAALAGASADIRVSYGGWTPIYSSVIGYKSEPQPHAEESEPNGESGEEEQDDDDDDEDNQEGLRDVTNEDPLASSADDDVIKPHSGNSLAASSRLLNDVQDNISSSSRTAHIPLASAGRQSGSATGASFSLKRSVDQGERVAKQAASSENSASVQTDSAGRVQGRYVGRVLPASAGRPASASTAEQPFSLSPVGFTLRFVP